MKLFFIGWSGKEVGLIEVVKKLKAIGHQIVYWTLPNIDQCVSRTDFPDTIFHDHYDALFGKPALGINIEKFSPASTDLIAEFYGVESTVLTMMSKKLESLLVEQRKHLYYHILQYWNGVLNQYRPDAIIFPADPHTVYDYVIYWLAKKSGIKTLMFESSAVNDRLIAVEDYQTGHPLLKRASWEIRPGNFKISDLSGDLRKYYNKHRQAADAQVKVQSFRDATYVNIFMDGRYGARQRFKEKFQLVGRSLLDFTLPKRITRFLSNRMGPNLKKEYHSVQSQPDFKKNFIYVPLHFQPEQSTVTQGGVFVDQILMIEILSASLPKDWLIYVKEHPFQWLPRGFSFFSARYQGYYEAIAKLPNVRIVPIETNSFELIHGARAVATVSGTAAWEGIMRSKPSLFFGCRWFQDAPGIFRVKDTESCKKAFFEIQSGYSIKEEDLLKFLIAFNKASFHGYTDNEWQLGSAISVEENTNNFLQAILNFLKGN